ncbi:mitochondrial ribosomal protein L46 isoform X2 [Andrena cerasifolii]|uniref:mitochondrial ribosomal protein L46 isoform X2 n=1 Tax=Andrena cerasifolii TaxID=2819439 RepID=UPI004037C8D1
MLRRILTFRTSNSTPFLIAGNPSASKVIFRASSQQDFETVEKWDLLSAVCLERHPIITKPMQDIETRFQETLKQIEFENSLLSDFEIQMKKEVDQKQKQKQKSEWMLTDSDTDIVSNQTKQDFLDSSEQELTKFKFAPRISEAEENSRSLSLKDKLDKHLILLVEQKVGNADLWIPPQSVRKQRETMIHTAYRTVQELCGNNIKVKFYGSAPIGFYQYKYPKDIRDKGRDGAKIFYFLAKYISGEISPHVKYCWLDREALKNTVHPNIYTSLSQFLLPD